MLILDDHSTSRRRSSAFRTARKAASCLVVGDEESVAYELREEGKATGEVRVVCNRHGRVPPDIYAATGYENVGELSWDDKAALGALLACMQLDGGAADPPPPYPEDMRSARRWPSGPRYSGARSWTSSDGR